jgi:hypothetical protein
MSLSTIREKNLIALSSTCKPLTRSIQTLSTQLLTTHQEPSTGQTVLECRNEGDRLASYTLQISNCPVCLKW